LTSGLAVAGENREESRRNPAIREPIGLLGLCGGEWITGLPGGRQQQIPYGNDGQECKGKNEGNGKGQEKGWAFVVPTLIAKPGR